MHIVGERRIALQLRRSAGHVRLPRYVGAQEERRSIFSVASTQRCVLDDESQPAPPEGTLSESVTGGRYMYSPLASLSSYM